MYVRIYIIYIIYIYLHNIYIYNTNITLMKAGDNFVFVFELSSHVFTFAGLNGVSEICHFCSVLVGERSNPVRL